MQGIRPCSSSMQQARAVKVEKAYLAWTPAFYQSEQAVFSRLRSHEAAEVSPECQAFRNDCIKGLRMTPDPRKLECNDEQASLACGCTSHQRTDSQGEAQNWHPRVDNSALGFGETGLSGLRDVVSYTAVSFAAYRAIETERSDALFLDPLAHYLASNPVVQRQKRELANEDYPGARFAVRTKYFDLGMISAIKELKQKNAQAKVQVALFGCGMDARGWRLLDSDGEGSASGPPAETLFEGDRPDVMSLKEQLLGKLKAEGNMPALTLAKRRVVLSVDFNANEWKRLLLEQGFQTSEPTVWLFEGLVMYLKPSAVIDLVETVASLSAPGSVLMVDGISAVAVARARNSPSPVLRSWTWGANDPKNFFSAHGWKVRNVDDVTAGMFGRTLPSWPGRERNITWYMTATVHD